MHQKFCKNKAKGFSLTTLRGHTIAANFDGDRKVVELLAENRKAEAADIQAVLKAVKNELGSQSIMLGSEEGARYYLYLTGLQIRGVLVTERVSSKLLVRLSDKHRTCDAMARSSTMLSMRAGDGDSGTGSRSGNSNGNGKDNADGDDDVLVLGVSMVWVHDNFRRRGIAATLCDTARRRFMFGSIVPRSRVAFSQPTEAGHAFAMSYAACIEEGEDEEKYYAFH